MNVKSGSTKTDAASGNQTANRGGWQNINTTQTPFTNIKTCNSALGAQTTGDSARNYNTYCSTLPRGVISAILQLYVSPAETFRRWIRSKILRDGFEPDMFSKVVSLLVILESDKYHVYADAEWLQEFQPFLRFYLSLLAVLNRLFNASLVSTLLEILLWRRSIYLLNYNYNLFQPFLRFYRRCRVVSSLQPPTTKAPFQPFLRFYLLCSQ
jgi:hypothetical protein